MMSKRNSIKKLQRRTFIRRMAMITILAASLVVKAQNTADLRAFFPRPGNIPRLSAEGKRQWPIPGR